MPKKAQDRKTIPTSAKSEHPAEESWIAHASHTGFYTTRQAAKVLGVSLRTIQLWMDSKVLSGWKTRGGHRRVDKRSVEKFTGKRIAAPGEEHSTLSGLRCKLLVVEDDPVLLKLYKMVIATWRLPVDVIPARNGIEALLAIGQESPDLMITDHAMPELDGLQLVTWLASSRYSDGMEMALVTGYADSLPPVGEALPGELKIFAKPVPFGELHAWVARRVTQAMDYAQGAAET